MQLTSWRHRRLQSEMRALRVRIPAPHPNDGNECLYRLIFKMIHRMEFVLHH